jgi:hypothetical protein
VAALGDDEMRDAMISHKQQLARATHPPNVAR